MDQSKLIPGAKSKGFEQSNKRKNKLAEDFYRQLLDDQIALICRIDSDAKVIFANEAFCKFFSLSADEIEGKKIYNFDSIPVDYETTINFIKQLTPNKPIKKHLNEFLISNGDTVWIEWTQRGFFNKAGQLIEIQSLGHDITELKNIQAQLQNSQENFKKLAQTAPALIYIFLPEEDRFLWVNENFGEFAGYTFEECMELKAWDLIHPDFREKVRADSFDILQKKIRSSRHDVKIVTKDGKVLWQDLAKSYIEWEGYQAVLGVGYDVTERKIAEDMLSQKNLELQCNYNQLEAMNQEIMESQRQLLTLNKQLQESRERLELALWGSNEGLWDWDFLNGEMYWNDRIVKMLGYDPQTFVYHVDTWREIIFPADKEFVWEKLKEHLQGKTAFYEVEYRIITKAGDLLWVFDRGKAVERDENGRAVRMVGMRMDISSRKEAEKAIIEARNLYSTLIAAIPELVVQFNLNYEFIWVNDQAKEFYGDGVLGSKMSQFFFNPADYGEMIEGLTNLMLLSSQNLSIETWQLRQDGENRLLQWLVKPLKTEGEVVAYLATARDLTEMHHAEEKIHFLSFHDSLTGLYNRAFASEEMQRRDQSGELPLSIIMGDVNALKLSNDAFGHFEGDRLIQTIASILQHACRKGDIIARWGGDEFVIILPRTTNKEAYGICLRIQQLCKIAPSTPIQPSIALGAATKERNEQNIYDVLAEAEDSMYRNKLLEGASLRNSIIASLEQSLHEKTHETQEHAQRMQELSIIFAGELELTMNEIDRLILLAKLHDIGKLGIPDYILDKPAALEEDEWETIKKHPEIGFRITTASHDLVSIAGEVLSHHERWDGKGYPRGLAGEEIPYLARIISIVDSYDVMTNGRAYKAALSKTEALNEIKRCAGTQFDPGLVEYFLRIMQ